MVLDSLGPEVGYARLIFQVVDVGLFAGLFLLFVGLFLLIRLHDTGNASLKLSESGIEFDARVVELLVGSFKNGITLLQDG